MNVDLSTYHQPIANFFRLPSSPSEWLQHRLSDEQIEFYRRNGYLAGIPMLSDEQVETLREELVILDNQIAPLAAEAWRLLNSRWGLLMRTGNDRSHFARQIERHADIYTSRVSNFLYQTPFVYLRSPRTSLPHDSGPSGGV